MKEEARAWMMPSHEVIFGSAINKLKELQLLAAYGIFHAACGCGFTSSSPRKFLEHVTKGHSVNWIIRLNSKASARRNRKIPGYGHLKGLLKGLRREEVMRIEY